MRGAIAGDIIGSRFEAFPIRDTKFDLFHDDCRFTDDTVLTVAVAEWLMSPTDLRGVLQDYFSRYPQAGYGMSFTLWAGHRKQEPYNSWGNGSAMRVSAIGQAFDTVEQTRQAAQESASVTHNHPEGVKGAQAVAEVIYLCRHGAPRLQIRSDISARYGYDLDRTVDQIRPDYRFDESCAGSVPESLLCFLEAESYEQAIRNAVSLGGDADTMAAIAGGLAEATFGLPDAIWEQAAQFLDDPLRDVIDRFETWLADRS